MNWPLTFSITILLTFFLGYFFGKYIQRKEAEIALEQKLKKDHIQQPFVKGITPRNGEEEVAGEVHEPVGVRSGGITQHPSADDFPLEHKEWRELKFDQL